jgi:predicted phage terminase large subunit-like protein
MGDRPARAGSGDREHRRRAALELLTIPYCPDTPTKTQAGFLLDLAHEALYGGGAGGGKSIALLMAALQFVTIPGYAAIIFRRSLSDLTLPSGLIPVSHRWLTGHARWAADEHTWHFPSGARLVFGYLDRANDMYRYQGAEFQFIGFDELTQFPEEPYRYLFSRLRGPSDPTRPLSAVPLRMRATANPGGEGHEWVRARFIAPWLAHHAGELDHLERTFHPARIADNPHLNADAYAHNLAQLPPVMREQLLHGDWDIRPNGGIFQREWFHTIGAGQVPRGLPAVRAWDLAATEPRVGTDPDHTVGIRVEHDHQTGIFYITDVVRMRDTAGQVEDTVRRTAKRDGKRVHVFIEQEGGSAGKSLIHHYRTHVLAGYTLHSERPSGDKVTRAYPVASRAEAGDIQLVDAAWTSTLLDELETFPHSRHDDQIDALSAAMATVDQRPINTFDPEIFGRSIIELHRDSPWNI